LTAMTGYIRISIAKNVADRSVTRANRAQICQHSSNMRPFSRFAGLTNCDAPKRGQYRATPGRPGRDGDGVWAARETCWRFICCVCGGFVGALFVVLLSSSCPLQLLLALSSLSLVSSEVEEACCMGEERQRRTTQRSSTQAGTRLERF
jgi:hypothetical protein